MATVDDVPIGWLHDLLPPPLAPLFDASFVRSHRLYGEFVFRLVLRVLRETGLDDRLEAPTTAGDLVTRSRLSRDQAMVPLDWMLRFLASRGALDVVDHEDGGRYRSRDALPVLDPAEIKQRQLAHDASWIPAYTLTETVAGDYPAFLRGDVAGHDVLFSPRRLGLWVDYFSNDNGLYAVNNRVGAVAAAASLPGAAATILELGGGLGSGAVALLAELERAHRLGAVAAYRFTEPVAAFLRRGERALRTRYADLPGLTFAPLDMNRSFGEQGVPPASVSLVYAVNTLHVAQDLEWTLGEVLRALEPGGRVVASECVRPQARQPVDAEFVFNLADAFRTPRLDPRYRPNGGFLTPEQWTAALETAGFVEVGFVPDVVRIRERVPDFTVAAVCAARPR